MKHIDDAPWLLRLQAGDLEALRYFFLRYYKPLCLKASLALGNITAAENLVQQVFRRIWLEEEYKQVTAPAADFFYERVHMVCEAITNETPVQDMQLSS